MKRTMLLLFLTCALTCVLCSQAHSQVLIIANSKVAATEVSAADLRDVFTGASTSLKASSHIVPVLLREGPVNEQMLSLYIGKSDSAFRATWRSLVFSGQGVMPKYIDSETSVVEFVAHTPGAIGYIGKATSHDGVKVLTIR